MEECFSLSQWPFYLAYIDDDGEEYPIKNEADLTEAIAYFVSGDDDHSTRGSEWRGLPAKITMRVDVVVEYDGPSLSDTSSIASLSSENSWSSGLTRTTGTESRNGSASFVSRDYGGTDSTSLASRQTPSIVTDPSLTTSYGANAAAVASASSLGYRSSVLERTYSPGFPALPTDQMAGIRFSTPQSHLAIPLRAEDSQARRRPMLSPHSAGSLGQHLLRPISSTSSPSAVAPTSPISPSETTVPLRETPPVPPPSLLSQSELGSRWLREQSQLASRVPLRAARRYDSDNESLSDDENIGDIALVRDERGRESPFLINTNRRLLLLVPEHGRRVDLVPLRRVRRLFLGDHVGLHLKGPPTLPPFRDEGKYSFSTTHAGLKL